MIISITCGAKIKNNIPNNVKNKTLATKNVLYNLFTKSEGFSFKSGINFEKTATVALCKGPPTPPKRIIANDGI